MSLTALFRRGSPAILLFLQLSVLAEMPGRQAAVDPTELFRQAWAQQDAAQQETTLSQREADLRRAIALYDQALAAKSDWGDALSERGACQLSLASNAPDAVRRQELLLAARQDWTRAVQLPNADWLQYRALAGLLVQNCVLLASQPLERKAILTEASQWYERALAVAKLHSRQVLTEAELAVCLIRLSDYTPDPSARRKLYADVLRHIDAVEGAAEVEGDPEKLRYFGLALVELGKLTGNPEYYRRALAKLNLALEAGPPDLGTEYNLACLLALTGKPAAALKRLSVCLVDPQQGAYFNSAATKDPDLATVRQLPEYAQLTSLTKSAPTVDPAALREQGTKLLAAAQANPQSPATVTTLQAALQLFQQLAILQPGRAAPLVWRAQTERELAHAVSNPKLSRSLIESARTHFADAAHCNDMESDGYLQWAQLLTDEIAILAPTPAEQAPLYREALLRLEAGLKVGAGERAPIYSALGATLLQLASLEPDATQRRDLYRRAVRQFETATRSDSEAQRSRTQYLWGLALVQLGKLDQDNTSIRTGLDRLTVAEQLAPADPAIKYTLAQTSAALNQPTAALVHLQECFQLDPSGAYRQRASTDPTLESVKTLPEFQQLVPTAATDSNPIQLPSPQISNH